MKSKINILYIYHVSSIGGGSFCLLNLIKKLDKELYNPIVLLKEYGPLCVDLEKLGAKVFFEKSISMVPYNRSLLELNSIKFVYSVLKSLKKVNNLIKELSVDIVYVNSMMLYPYLYIAHRLKKKTVIHIREHWPQKEHRFQFKLAQNIIKRYSDRIIAINEFSAGLIGDNDKTKIIYDWIDFSERDEKINFVELFGKDFKSLKIFLFLGGTMRIKGALDVVDVFSNQILSKDVRLLLVGCDNKEVEYNGFKGKIAKVLSRINYNTYSNKVKLLAQKDDRIVFIPTTYQVKSLIEQSFCLVSFFTIPHANLAIAESTWLGKLSIAADTPEAKEYTADGKAALLFKMNDKEEFRTKVLYALEHDNFNGENQMIGQSIIRKKFDPDRNAKSLNDIYQDMLLQ